MVAGCWWLVAAGGGWLLVVGAWRLMAGYWRLEAGGVVSGAGGAYRSLYLAKNVCGVLCRFYERSCRIGLVLENVCENLEGVVCWSGKSLLWTYKNI